MADDGAAPRAAAARAVAMVWGGRSLDDALIEARADLSGPDQGLAAAMAYGVVREQRLLSALARPLLRRQPQRPVQALILAGLFQLRSMRVPAHAALHATVGATPMLGHSKARGLVNAVLRRFQRERERLEAQVPDEPGVRTSHPDWLVDCLRTDWPDGWQALLAANNAPAPMTLRVNRRRVDRDACIEQIAAAGIEARAHPHASDAVTLTTPMAVDDIPGFADGWISVQDAAAQLAVPLLDVKDGMRVLDACAAPGGKAAHCLEHADCELTALDNDAQRLRSVADNLQRLGLDVPSPRGERARACPGRDPGERGAVLMSADASEPSDWWDGRPFDRILIDAPCTGTGVIRRHPDIKWLRREDDVRALAERQRALLDALWPLLSPDGVLVYATCSVLRAEGADAITAFSADTPDAGMQSMTAEWGEPERVGRRIAPGEAGMDGFYYARLAKRG